MIFNDADRLIAPLNAKSTAWVPQLGRGTPSTNQASPFQDLNCPNPTQFQLEKNFNSRVVRVAAPALLGKDILEIVGCISPRLVRPKSRYFDIQVDSLDDCATKEGENGSNSLVY